MPTKAELKQLNKNIKLKIRKGDQVMIIAGKDKGEVGHVYAVSPREQRVIVLKKNTEGQLEPLNAVVKHRKARMQGERSARFSMPSPLHVSNVMVLDPKTGSPSRVGRKLVDGKAVRYAKKSGEVIPEPAMNFGTEE